MVALPTLLGGQGRRGGQAVYGQAGASVFGAWNRFDDGPGAAAGVSGEPFDIPSVMYFTYTECTACLDE